MKILLDSNVLVAAFATRGLCAGLFEICIKSHIICCNEIILREVEKAFLNKLKEPKSLARQKIEFMKNQFVFFDPEFVETDACRDVNDLHILGTAAIAKVDCMVTGDQDLLVLKEFKNIPIYNPREFWELLSHKT